MTQAYVGTKIIAAWPEEKDGKEGYAVRYDDAYISWSPKDVFERCYRPITNAEHTLIDTYQS